MSIILDGLNKAEQSKEGAAGETAQAPDAAAAPVSGLFHPEKRPALPKLKVGSKKSKAVLIVLCLVGLAAGIALKTLPGKLAVLVNAATNKKDSVVAKAPLPVVPQLPKVDKSAPSEREINDLKNRAARNFELGRIEESAESFEKLTLLLPTDADIYNSYGLALRKSGSLKEAREAYGKAIALRPDFAEAYNNLAVAQMGLGEYNEAKHNLQRAIELKSDYIDPYLHLALCLEKNGETQASIGYYQSFLKMSEGKMDRKVRLQVEGRIARLSEEAAVTE